MDSADYLLSRVQVTHEYRNKKTNYKNTICKVLHCVSCLYTILSSRTFANLLYLMLLITIIASKMLVPPLSVSPGANHMEKFEMLLFLI